MENEITQETLEEWYIELEKLEQSDIVGTAYGCGIWDVIETDADWEYITMFFEFITDYYDELPDWANTFFQIYCWQFQNFHEGLDTYYEDFYGGTDYESIMRAREFLTKEGYDLLASCYNHVLFEEDVYSLEQIAESFQNTAKWIGEHDKVVQDFYIDVLKKHHIYLSKVMP